MHYYVNNQKVSEHDHEMLEQHTADQHTAPEEDTQNTNSHILPKGNKRKQPALSSPTSRLENLVLHNKIRTKGQKTSHKPPLPHK